MLTQAELDTLAQLATALVVLAGVSAWWCYEWRRRVRIRKAREKWFADFMTGLRTRQGHRRS